MTYQKVASGLFAISLATCSVAHAQTTRAFVSGVGDDANPCSRTSPCRSFAGALTKVSAGGEIDALDSANYGTLAINKAITIDGSLGATAGITAVNATAITIGAGASDTVILRNLSIAGSGTPGDGIHIDSAGVVYIEKTSISGFSNNGIAIVPSTPLKVFIDAVKSNSNGANGLLAQTFSGVTTNVAIKSSSFDVNAGAGVNASGTSKISATDTTASGNANGFYADASLGGASVTITRCDASSNTSAGLLATSNGVVRAANSSVELNGKAIITGNGGLAISFGNNSVTGGGVFTNTVALR